MGTSRPQAVRMRELLFAILVVVSSITALDFKGDQVLTFTVRNQKQLDGLIGSIKNLSGIVDLWRPHSVNDIQLHSPVDARIPRAHLKDLKEILEQEKIDFRVKIKDVERFIKRSETHHRIRRDATYDYDVYHTYEEIDDWTREIANDYPNLVRRERLGYSYERRNITKLIVGSSPDNPQILIDCGIHGREWIAPAFCQCYVHRLVSSYNEVYEIRKMLDQLTFIVVPLLNPDGYAYSHNSDRFWRKTRSRHFGSRCVGVDGNRNFDAKWAGPGSSSRSCSSVYHGPRKNSEPMTKALTRYIDENINKIKAYITFHSYGQVFVFPYSYAAKDVENKKEHEDVARDASDAIFKVNGKRYTYGPGHKSMYLAAGGSDDMAKDHGVDLVFTIELRDLGTYGFLLPENQINDVCTETYAGMDVIAKHIMKKAKKPK